jgi:hypothetical protein
VTSDLTPGFSPGDSTGRQLDRGLSDTLDCSAGFCVAYLLRLSYLQEPGPGFQREWPAELMRDCPKLAAESPHNSKPTLQGLLLGAAARAWGSLFLQGGRCHQRLHPFFLRAPSGFPLRPTLVRLLSYRSAGWYTRRRRYDYQPQSDEPRHGRAPCWLVCLNAKHPNRSKPISEGSPSTWRRASTQANLTRRSERETPRRLGMSLPVSGLAHARRRATLPWVTDRVAALRAWIEEPRGGAL